MIQIDYYLDTGAYLPEKAHNADAGFDIRTPAPLCIPAHGSGQVDTGVHLIVPKGYCGKIESKSGLSMKHNLECGAGVVDSGYSGSIVVKLYNHGSERYWFDAGDKIAQIIIEQTPNVSLHRITRLPQTERGSNGFGSSGR